MALTKFTDNVEIIQALSNTPNATEGLTADQLKAKFDDAANKIKTYLNDTLTEEIDVIDAAVSDKIDKTAVVDSLTSTSATDPLSANQGKILNESKIPNDGWSSANETWAYASATTITVPAGALLKYSKGYKIKLTQGTVKYFYVIGISDTTLTITGGSNYTLTSATITEPYYSNADSPHGFPSYFSHTPSYIGFSSAPTIHMQFKIIGSTCMIHGYASGAGTSNSNQFKIKLPVAPIPISSIRTYCIGYGTDNGATTQATFVVSGAEDANNLIVCKGITESPTSWTASGAKYCNPPAIIYEF